MGMRRIRGNAPLACAIVSGLFAGVGSAQSIRELQALQVPRELALSADGAELFFKLGPDYWKIATSWNAKAVRSAAHASAKAGESPKVEGTPRVTAVTRSPDGAKIAYLDSAGPATALNLFCRCDGESSDSRKVSDLPIRSYQWAGDSTSFWVLLSNGADIAFGRLSQDGRFKQMSRGAALRGLGGLAAANDVVAWVQSDSSRHGAIWIKDKADKIYQLWDRMFLYSFSTGASAIDQLLTQTTAFRAAVSFAGVADWLEYYRANQPRGDDTIPNFLSGKRPEDSPDLYDRISPVKHVDRIQTPLLLTIGDKDSIPGGGKLPGYAGLLRCATQGGPSCGVESLQRPGPWN